GEADGTSLAEGLMGTKELHERMYAPDAPVSRGIGSDRPGQGGLSQVDAGRWGARGDGPVFYGRSTAGPPRAQATWAGGDLRRGPRPARVRRRAGGPGGTARCCGGSSRARPGRP